MFTREHKTLMRLFNQHVLKQRFIRLFHFTYFARKAIVSNLGMRYKNVKLEAF